MTELLQFFAYLFMIVMIAGGPAIGITWYIQRKYDHYKQCRQRDRKIKEKARRQHLKKHGSDEGIEDGK